MKVYFIGAGPGDPKLMTIKGRELIERCPIILYTGSLVPKVVVASAKEDAQILDSASMNLESIIEVFKQAKDNDQDVARVHTGDPALFSSIAEQIRMIEDLKIEYEVIPGVSSFAASAAALGKELTLPEVSQTVIITRAQGRTPVPEKEQLHLLGSHQATMVLFLSAGLIHKVVEELTPHYGSDCPVAVIEKVTWSEQKIISGCLENIENKMKDASITATAIIIVGKVLKCQDFANSLLYDAAFTHGFRQGTSERC